MPPLSLILLHTPWWAFALAALLTALGVQALRPRIVTPRRLLIVPAVFITWGMISLAAQSMQSPLPPLIWLATTAVGMTFGWWLVRMDRSRFDPVNRTIAMPGSAQPLVRNLVIFLAKYGLGIALAVAPAWHGQIVLWDIAVSGLSAGFFGGWLLRFALALRGASRLEAATVGR